MGSLSFIALLPSDAISSTIEVKSWFTSKIAVLSSAASARDTIWIRYVLMFFLAMIQIDLNRIRRWNKINLRKTSVWANQVKLDEKSTDFFFQRCPTLNPALKVQWSNGENHGLTQSSQPMSIYHELTMGPLSQNLIDEHPIESLSVRWLGTCTTLLRCQTAAWHLRFAHLAHQGGALTAGNPPNELLEESCWEYLCLGREVLEESCKSKVLFQYVSFFLYT